MLPFAHVLLWSLVLVPSLAQTSPSLCGQTKTSKSQALNDCCPAFDKKTDTFPDGEAYSYHCNSILKLTRYGGKAPLDPGTCAQACSKDENCVGASWDSTSSASCWFTSIVKKDGNIVLRHALPSLDCSSQISSAVSSASVSIQAAASGSCASKASDSVRSAQAAAETSCSSRITSAVDSASSAISGAVASAQSAAETSCSSRITSAVGSAITSGASIAISGAVASAQTACQSSIASANSAASSNALAISASVSQSVVSDMVEYHKYNCAREEVKRDGMVAYRYSTCSVKGYRMDALGQNILVDIGVTWDACSQKCLNTPSCKLAWYELVKGYCHLYPNAPDDGDVYPHRDHVLEIYYKV